MAETPRQYKKRIDEKWKKNAKNRDKLIQQIEKYELVDDDFKAKTKQEILDNFEKNLNADKNGELYLTVGKELEKIDVKYDELAKMKENLKLKKQEKVEIEKEIKGSKLDGKDETTLTLQMVEIKKLNEKFEAVKLEIEELEKNIKDRKSELKEIEENYGEKQDTVIFNSGGSHDEKFRDGNDSLSNVEMTDKESSTLKEYRELTLQDLWNKDRTRGKIFGILEDGTGIDDKLKDKIEKEISDRFFEHYDEKQGSLRMRSARFLKNKIREKEKNIENIMDMPQGEAKESKIAEIKRQEKAYFGKNSDLRKLIELREFSKKNGYKLVENEKVLNIGGKPVFKAKDSEGNYRIYRGDIICGHGYKEIGEIKEIGGKPVFWAKGKNYYGDNYYCVHRGIEQRGEKYDVIGEIEEKNGQPAFFAKSHGRIYRIG